MSTALVFGVKLGRVYAKLVGKRWRSIIAVQLHSLMELQIRL
jgi:hypothetical protein